MSNIEQFAKELAVLAGTYAKEQRNNIQVSSKGGDYRDVVTNVDLEITKLLAAKVAEAFPDHVFYSEEAPVDFSGTDTVWVVDPIDGTSNYARKLPLYSSCVTVIKQGEVITSAVYQPVTQDLFLVSEAGVTGNGEPVQVSDVTELAQAYVNFHPGRKPEHSEWAGALTRQLLQKAKKTINYGSSALDLAYVATGRLDLVIYGTLTTIDIAGAIEMVRRAGGEVYNYDTKEPVEVSGEKQRIIAVANQALLEDYFRMIV
jgi:myo-inositol-1(or 4)-monophosphatase